MAYDATVYNTLNWLKNEINGRVKTVNGTAIDSTGNVSITIPAAVTSAQIGSWGYTKSPEVTSATVGSWGYTKSPEVTSATVGSWGYTKNTGTVKSVNSTSPDSNGNVSITIPAAVTSAQVGSWGYTKNAGTVKSVNSTSPDANGNVSITIPAAVTSAQVGSWGYTKNPNVTSATVGSWGYTKLTQQDVIDTIESQLSGDAPTSGSDPSAGTAAVNVTNIYNELQLLAYFSGASAGNNTIAGETTKEIRIAAHSAPDAVNSSGQNSKWDTAGLYLYGKDLLKVNGTADTGNAGNFKLQTAYNSDGVQSTLIGSQNGTLTWSGTVKAADFVMTSDRRMKENLVEIDSCLEKVDALTPYTFNFIDDEKKVRHAGIIAQDVEKVLPEAVTEVDDVKRVSYDSLIPLLIGAIKELKAENAELRKMIESK